MKCECMCMCVLVINFWGTSCMNEVIPDLDRRHVASSQCSYTAGGTIRPCATHKDDMVILCGHNSVDTGAPQFITTPARKKISCLHCGDFPENLASRVCVCVCLYMLVYVCRCMLNVCVSVYVYVKVNVVDGVCECVCIGERN